MFVTLSEATADSAVKSSSEAQATDRHRFQVDLLEAMSESAVTSNSEAEVTDRHLSQP